MIQRGLLGLTALAVLAAFTFAEDVSHHPAHAWKSSIYGGFASQSGNTEEKSYQYGGEFEKKNGSAYRYKLKVDGKYRKTDGEVSDSKVEGIGEMRRLFTERWFYSGKVAALHDDLKAISYRTRLGPGVGRYVVDSDRLTADMSTGLVHVHEKTANDSSDYLAWRLSQWFDWQALETLRWWVGSELFVNISDAADYLLTFQTGIDNKINSHFSLIFVVKNEYDSLPESDDIKKNDFEVSAGLRYTF